MAYQSASKDAKSTMEETVPLNLRNAVTKLDKELGNGAYYQYAHDFENKITNMQCLPDSLKDKTYYYPTNSGHESKWKEILKKIKEIKKKI